VLDDPRGDGAAADDPGLAHSRGYRNLPGGPRQRDNGRIDWTCHPELITSRPMKLLPTTCLLLVHLVSANGESPGAAPIVREKQKAPEYEKCTLEQLEAAKAADYSDDVTLQLMGNPTKLAREGSSPIPTVINLFVARDGKYLTHGYIGSDPFDPERLCPGIPKDADPVALAVLPPPEGRSEPIVLRYHLRDRC
jgi:hypothetical protein